MIVSHSQVKTLNKFRNSANTHVAFQHTVRDSKPKISKKKAVLLIATHSVSVKLSQTYSQSEKFSVQLLIEYVLDLRLGNSYKLRNVYVHTTRS